MVAFIIAQAVIEKFGGDSLPELKRNHAGYISRLSARLGD
jgi:chorismate synthase